MHLRRSAGGRLGLPVRRTAVAVTAALALSVLATAPVQAAFPADTNGVLAVYDGSVHVVNADGSGRRRVSWANAGDAGSPVWSADGRKLAYVHSYFVWDAQGNRSTKWQLRVIGVDGTDRIVFSRDDGRYIRFPSWSPNGTTLAFQMDGGGTPQIFTVNIDGGGLTRVTNNAFANSPAWSPDGTKIAFSDGRDIFTVAPDGSGVQRLTQAPADNNRTFSGPVWHPGGNRLAVVVQEWVKKSEDPEVWHQYFSVGQVSAAGGTMGTLVPRSDTFNTLSPAYSPDGAFLAYTKRTHEQANDVLVMRLGDGQLVSTIGAAYSPDWQPCPTGTCPVVGLKPTTTDVSCRALPYGEASKMTVKVSSTGGTPTGSVTLTRGGQTVGTATVSQGVATFTVPGDLRVGAHTFTATYSGNDTFARSTDSCVGYVKAASTLSGRLNAVIWRQVSQPWITGTLTVTPHRPATGKIQLLVDGKVVKSALLTTDMMNRFIMKVPRLPRGAHTLKMRYRGSNTVMPSATGKVQVRVIR